MKLDETSWGFYIAIGVLSSAFGVHLFKKYSDWDTRLLLLLFLGSFLLIGLVTHPIIALVGMFIAYFFRGYLEAKLGVEINQAISSHARASILSLESFLTRIVSTIFTLVLGVLTAQVSFSLLMVGSAVFLLLVGSYPLLRLKKI